MKAKLIAATALTLFISAPSLVLAAEGAATGAVGGAVAGAVIGGPVGAVVGGVAGAAIGGAAETPPPPAVRQYVIQEQVPSVAYQGQVVVGQPLPGTVQVYQIPQYQQYGYTVINGQRVIIDPGTRRVIEVVQ